MIKWFQITNHLGDSILIDLWKPEQSGFLIKSVSGLEPPQAVVNTKSYATNDGAVLNSVKLNQRNIVFDLIFVETVSGESIEDIRQKSYKYFPMKKPIEVMVKTDNRTVKTTGYVESNDPNLFSSMEGSQISIICPDAYWYSATNTTASYADVIGAFTFPFAISERGVPLGFYNSSEYIKLQNNGDETGLTIQITGIGKANKTTTNLTIYNAGTGDYMRIREPIQSGDRITITTHRGHKTCQLVRDGVQINWIGSLLVSKWLTVPNGESVFYISTETGMKNVALLFTLTEAYTGV